MSKKFYMSHNQKRLYIINQLQGNDVSYNTPKVLRFFGKVDIEKLEWSFNQLIQRHELLRTTFDHNGDQFYQIVEESLRVKIEVSDENQTSKV